MFVSWASSVGCRQRVINAHLLAQILQNRHEKAQICNLEVVGPNPTVGSIVYVSDFVGFANKNTSLQ